MYILKRRSQMCPDYDDRPTCFHQSRSRELTNFPFIKSQQSSCFLKPKITSPSVSQYLKSLILKNALCNVNTKKSLWIIQLFSHFLSQISLFCHSTRLLHSDYCRCFLFFPFICMNASPSSPSQQNTKGCHYTWCTGKCL